MDQTALPTDKTYANQLKAAAILEAEFQRQPEHPGLAHYIIHSFDVAALAPRALDAARRYAAIAPDAAHALHMPSHTFTRVGAWQESIDTNLGSAAAARKDNSVAEELHALDYQAYASLQTAQDGAAKRTRDAIAVLGPKMSTAGAGNAAPPNAGYYALAAIPARYALERDAWVEAAALTPRQTPFAWADAVTHFARALGAARSGHAAAARQDIARLAELRDAVQTTNDAYWTDRSTGVSQQAIVRLPEHGSFVYNRAMTLTGLKAMLLACVAGASLLYAQGASLPGEWQTYSGDSQGRRYSALTQINTTNILTLKLAWQYGVAGTSPGSTPRTAGRSQAVPILVRGVLYTSTARRTIVALDPATGQEIWKHELGKGGAPNRGVSYWPGDRQFSPRILAGTTDGRLIALDAAKGTLVPTFGDHGAIDLRVGVADTFPKIPYMMASPGLIYRNLIVTGAQGQEDSSEGPAMDVRAWDIRTGTLVWTFHTIPHPGEPGGETWPKDYWKTAGTPANWGFGSVDTARGLIFLPIGQPAAQYYGGHRAQTNLYSSSVVALDANSGKVRWSFQLTHHDVWDYDNAATPALVDVVRNGRRIPAVVTTAKSGLMFFLERETGKPIYPVEERPVPASDIPGEATWPTQPFPVKPPPLSRLSITTDEIFKGEPAHEKFCRELAEKIGGIHNLGPYTPYSTKEFRVIFPGQQGGPNFGGVAVDQTMGYVFVNSRDVGGMGRLDKTSDGDTVAYRRVSPLGRGTVNARFWNPENSQPCQTPPWAHLMAINANTGDIAWKVPLGTSDELEAKGIKNTGAFGQGGPIATAGGLVFIAGTIDKRFRAFDSRTGQMLWEARLESEGHTTPMTYMAGNGKQYVVVVTTGVNAFTLE